MIADQPFADLLKYVNNLLDDAVTRSRLPSGCNPLQQLENLERCVRDILSTKRMVAFLILDSPNDSIMDLEQMMVEASGMQFSKYLDSFAFPYYVVLKNIKALPRTIADLLRQASASLLRLLHCLFECSN